MSGFLHSGSKIYLVALGIQNVCTSAMISALVIVSVAAVLAPNLDGAAFFAGIHSPLFNRLR